MASKELKWSAERSGSTSWTQESTARNGRSGSWRSYMRSTNRSVRGGALFKNSSAGNSPSDLELRTRSRIGSMALSVTT